MHGAAWQEAGCPSNAGSRTRGGLAGTDPQVAHLSGAQIAVPTYDTTGRKGASVALLPGAVATFSAD